MNWNTNHLLMFMYIYVYIIQVCSDVCKAQHTCIMNLHMYAKLQWHPVWVLVMHCHAFKLKETMYRDSIKTCSQVISLDRYFIHLGGIQLSFILYIYMYVCLCVCTHVYLMCVIDITCLYVNYALLENMNSITVLIYFHVI